MSSSKATGRTLDDRLLPKTNDSTKSSELDGATKLVQLEAKIRDQLEGGQGKVAEHNYNQLVRDTLKIYNMVKRSVEEKKLRDLSMVMQPPHYIHLYADLCKELHLAEQKQTGTDSRWSICSAIIEMTKNSYEQAFERRRKQTDRSTDTEKRKMTNTIKFIAHLHRVGLLDGEVIINYISALLRIVTSDENACTELIEYCATLIKEVDPYFFEKAQFESKVGNCIHILLKCSPEFMKIKMENEERVVRVRKDIRALLNKITPSKFAVLCREMTNMKLWRDNDSLLTAVELIFVRCVTEPIFVAIYVDLLFAQHLAEQEHEGANCRHLFYSVVIQKIHDAFQNITQSTCQEAIERIKKEMEGETDKQKIADHKGRIDELMGKEKRRMKGLLIFIAHLYRVELLNGEFINHYIAVLLRSIALDENLCNELIIEYVVTLFKVIGLYTNKSNSRADSLIIDDYIFLLRKYKSKVSNRVRFMIMDLEDMSKTGWQQKETGPKSIAEVRRAYIEEEEQKKCEREAYVSLLRSKRRRERKNRRLDQQKVDSV